MSDNTPEPFVFSRPIVVDNSKIEILDLKLFARLPLLASDEQAAALELPNLIDLLDKIIEGGLAGRPASEFWPLVEEAGKQIRAAGNPKT